METPERIDARVKVADWDLAFDQYWLVEKPKGVTQEKFADKLGVLSTYLSAQFSEVKAKRIFQGAKSKMPNLMDKALDNILKTLDEVEDRNVAEDRTGISAEFKAKFSEKVFTSMADRLGMAPAAVTLNMQQNNSNNTLQAPIFAGIYKDEASKMFEDKA